MKKNILNIFCFVFVALISFSCAQNETSFGNIVKDNKPTIPVTVSGTGVFTFGGNPTLPVSVAAGASGAIDFTLSIPANSGRTIREITAVSAGGTGVTINAGAVTSLTTVKLFPAPVAVGGTEYKFSTTVAAVKAKYPALSIVPVATLPAGASVVQTFRVITFLFLVTLDNGDQIVTVPVDCRLIP